MRPVRSLAAALADSPAGGLLHKLEHWHRIADIIASDAARLAPDFDARDPRACQLKDDVLVLNAGSAAQAAKLRQGLPGLQRLLHQRGTQVSEIRVRVQPAPKGYPDDASVTGAVTPIAEPLPAGAAHGALRMAELLAESLPASALRERVVSLQRVLQGRLGGPLAVRRQAKAGCK